MQACLKKNEGYVYKFLIDKRKKNRPKFQLNDIVRVTDLKKTFSKGDTTNCSKIYIKLQKILMIQYRVIALIK